VLTRREIAWQSVGHRCGHAKDVQCVFDLVALFQQRQLLAGQVGRFLDVTDFL